MKQLIKNNFGVILFSVTVHAIIFSLMIFNFDQEAEPRTLTIKPNIIKAVAVDANKVLAEIEKLKRADASKKQKETDRIAKLKRQENKLRKQRIAEEKRLAKLKKNRRAEEKRRKLEQAKLTKLKKQQQALKKQQSAKDKQRKVAEKKRQLEKAQQAKLKKQRDAIKKKQALAKKKRAVEATQRKNELAQQLAAEEQARDDKLAKTEREKYEVLIRQKIERNWLKPPGKLTGLLSVVNIRLIPGGDVVAANITRTSGNLVYDRSVERAALKASPLPLPRNPAIAAQLYNINLEFRAE